MNFNLVHERWIPVTRQKGDPDLISPFQVTSQHDINPVVAFAWPRPDFDLACHELLIGFLAAIYPADPREDRQWVRLFHEPPRPEALAAAFAPFADAFILDGDGPRFLQDFEPLDGEELPVDALLIEAPGANTAKLNKDLFIKRGQTRVLSRAAAAMALYTLQQFAPSGGAGHRTSLRGGGPLVTLVLPEGGPDSHPTLWQRLWLNTPADVRFDPRERSQGFPWLAPTRTSAKGEVVHAADAHPLQAFFGMPRRIRLVFAENVAKQRCDLTGVIDERICTGFITKPYGVNYGVWRHPTTPYYKAKATSNDPALPVHAPEGRLGYRQWLGLVYECDATRIPANALLNAKDRLRNLGRPWTRRSRLLAGGYAMDNMKALAFTESEMPLHQLDHELAHAVESFARLMVDAASVAVSILGIALRRALFGSKSEVKSDTTILDSPRERFWEITEDDFHETLDRALDALAKDSEGEKQDELAENWRKILQRAAFTIFDDTVPIESFDELQPEDIVEARRFLYFAMRGDGKLGSNLFKALGLTSPATKRKVNRRSKGSANREMVQ